MYKYCLYIMDFAGNADAALLPRSRLSVLPLSHRCGSIASMAALRFRPHVLTFPPVSFAQG